jgi:hypothetical protein
MVFGLSLYYIAIMMFNSSLPLESLVNSRVGNLRSLIVSLSTISTILQASSELREDGLGAKPECCRICRSRYLLASARRADGYRFSWQTLILGSARPPRVILSLWYILYMPRFGLVMI